MKCQACDREIALAKQCPYCGKIQKDGGKKRNTTRTTGRDRSHKDKSYDDPRPRSEFKGRLDDDRPGSSRVSSNQPLSFFSVLRYLLDPDVPTRRKWILYGAILYIASPIDILPGYMFGPLGWLDDLGVLTFALQWLRREINRTYR